MSMDRKNGILGISRLTTVKMANLSNWPTKPTQFPSESIPQWVEETDRLILKNHIEMQRTQDNQNNFGGKGKNQVKRLMLLVLVSKFTTGAPVWCSPLRVPLLVLAQVLISAWWDWVSCQALCSARSLLGILSLSLYPSLTSLSLKKKNKLLRK